MNSRNSEPAKRIVILGHGAMGTVFGAALQRAGHSVVFLGRNSGEAQNPTPLPTKLVALDGSSQDIEIDAAQPPSVVADADLVIVLVKTPETVNVIGRIAPFLSPETPVITLQNGLRSADRIRDVLGSDHIVIRGVTSQGATRTKDHEVIHTGEGPTQIGVENDRGREPAEWISSLFHAAGIPTSVVDTIEHEIWKKVTTNAAINGVTALCGVTNGAIAENPELCNLAIAVANEASFVAAVQGVQLCDVESAVIETAIATARNRSSMLQDIDAGRPTEANAIYGEIQRAAREKNVATPHIDALLTLIKARSKTAGAKENLREQYA